jgi:hypothetical protein
MARNEKRRQKALLKKRRKDKERKKRSNSSTIFGFDSYLYKVEFIKKAKEFPIYECLINAEWQDNGLAKIILSRKQPNNNLIIGVFLVDIYCLGLKNTFCNANISLEDYKNLKLRMFQQTSIITCQPRLANRIIYGAIEYARKLGFEPQKDFELSRFILDEPYDVDFSFNVEFGKNGKPLYIAGPDDDVDYVIKKLIKNVGEGNFDYILGFHL